VAQTEKREFVSAFQAGWLSGAWFGEMGVAHSWMWKPFRLEKGVKTPENNVHYHLNPRPAAVEHLY
jgi:hypothetical protein